MLTEQTTLEWGYQPPDFFEAAFIASNESYAVEIGDGQARVRLTDPQDPVPSDLVKTIRGQLESVFLARSVIVHRPFSLSGPTVRQERPGGTASVSHFLSARARAVVVASGRVDFRVTDSSGNIKFDSRAERIDREAALIDHISTAAMRDSLMQALVRSYQAAIAEPASELVRLYEITDALQKHYRGEKGAYRALGEGTEGHWKRLKLIANALPVEEGRHGGQHIQQLRPATSQELSEARGCARWLIAAYARTVVSGLVDRQDLTQVNQGGSQ